MRTRYFGVIVFGAVAVATVSLASLVGATPWPPVAFLFGALMGSAGFLVGAWAERQ